MAWLVASATEQIILVATKQDTVSKSLYDLLSVTPTYGQMVVLYGTVWNMFNEENKQLIKKEIQESGLKSYYTKLSIMENIVKHAPALDMSLKPPVNMKEILDILGVNSELKLGELVPEINKNVPKLLVWIKENGNNVIPKIVEEVFALVKSKLEEAKKLASEKMVIRRSLTIKGGKTNSKNKTKTRNSKNKTKTRQKQDKNKKK